MDFIKSRLKELSTWNGIVLGLGYIITYFTPDDIDKVVNTVVGILVTMNVAIPEKKA